MSTILLSQRAVNLADHLEALENPVTISDTNLGTPIGYLSSTVRKSLRELSDLGALTRTTSSSTRTIERNDTSPVWPYVRAHRALRAVTS